jgi:hypothetical protein
VVGTQPFRHDHDRRRPGISVSAWLSEAAADRIRNELLGAALDAWESEDGAFTEAELDAASRLAVRVRPV